MNYYEMSQEEVKKAVNGNFQPLTEEKIKERQKEFGKNELVDGKGKGVIWIFLEQFKDFLVIILMIAALVSGILKDKESAIVILTVIIINAILGTVQTLKAEQSLNSLKELSTPEAKVLRNGNVIKIPSAEITVGDEVYLEAGDYIPADGRLLEAVNMKADESALTGESLGVEKTQEKLEGEKPLGDRINMVYSGSHITYGRGSFLVTSIGMDTEVGKIAKLLKNTSEKKTPLQISLDQFGKRLSIIILVFCAILFAISVVRGESIGSAFLFAVALAVAAIPEALSSIVTIVLSLGTQKMAKEHAIIRKLKAVEGLGSVSIICSDKTGTLTQNKMTVEHYYVEERKIEAEKIDLEEACQEQLFTFSILCNDAAVIQGKEIGDPTETAFIHFGNKYNKDAGEIRSKYKRISEVPFDSDRKLMSTLNQFGEETVLITKGAVDVLLNRVVSIQKDGKVCDITLKDKEKIQEVNKQYSESGLRVLGFTYKKMQKDSKLKEEDENGLTFVGLVAMMDPPREESKAAVKDCISAGIKPIMITGDHKVTASAIAKRIGILQEESEACEGAVIENMTDKELENFVENISVYARVSPEHKIRIVRAWQEKGNIVAMTGDGVNDAPALKQADIGVAMGITGSGVAKDAASMILTDDNFATIIKAVENGRNVYKNIKKSIQFLLSGNFGAILAVLYASILALPVPFAPVHLLFINLLTDSLPAIALGLEPHNKEVMKESPRPNKESILTKSFLLKIGSEGFIIGCLTMAAFLIGYRNGNKELASTMAFGTLCLGRLFHGFNCKADASILFKKTMWNNRYLIGAFLLGAVMMTAVLTMPFLQGIFKVQSLSVVQLLTVYGLAFANLPLIQLLKKIRSKSR